MTRETWLPVVGFEGFYEVSDLGRVRGIDRRRSDGSTLRGRVLVPYLDARGYLRVQLFRHGDRSRPVVHRLVLTAFVGARPEGMVCRHGNGDALDNRLSNLRWGTVAENNRDTVRHGTHSEARRTTCDRGHVLEARPWRPGHRWCSICYTAARNERTRAIRDARVSLGLTHREYLRLYGWKVSVALAIAAAGRAVSR